jgi:C-terminal processing protease CtpA/Prc
MKLRVAWVATIALTASLVLAEARPGWLGFGFTFHRNEKEQWLHVRTIATGGPAEKAGLKVDDVIYQIDGKKVNAHDDLAMLEALARVKPGQVVTLGVVRAERRLRVRITAAAMSDERYRRWQLNLEVAKRKRGDAQ